ncbi:uncharacterized protein LOC18778621 [Prunus persica]|uniref:uncharacterized protein LOC18778621 n=1 Tax=Prunus persica TaxID=3760 RepID=UPI0009AB90BC|nr:uncharacterized protein LOC18778621 [Prunus persica]
MVKHMLLLCPWMKAVWFDCPFGYSPDLASISTLDSWLIGFLSSTFVDGDQRDWGVSLFMFCSWEIWKARCKALFKDLRPSPQLVLSQAISCLEEFSRAKDLATCAPLINSGAPTRLYWSSPPLPFVKINIDGAWEAQWVVIRDHTGSLVGATAQYCYLSSAAE